MISVSVEVRGRFPRFGGAFLPFQPCIQNLSLTSKTQLESSSSLKPDFSPIGILITCASLWSLPFTKHDTGQQGGLTTNPIPQIGKMRF